MALMDIFRSSPQQPARVEPVVPQQQTTQVAGNPTVPGPNQPGGANPSGAGPAAFPATGTGEQSPLAKFDKLWEVDGNKPQAPGQLLPNMTLDPTKLGQAAAAIDFTKNIPADLVTKAMSGDASAFLEVINKATQFGFANSAAATGEFIKQSFSQAQGQLESNFLPSAIRNTQIQQTMADNPAFKSPAMAPLLVTLSKQLAVQYPTAQPAEIASMAQEYLTSAAQTIVQGSGGQILGRQDVQKQTAGQTDWESYFGNS